MDELAKAVQKKYIEDITKKYPLHRFLVLFLLLLSSYIYSKEKNSRIIESIKEIKISFIFDFKDGIISLLTFEQLFICIILTSLISYMYNFFNRKSFKLLSNVSDFNSYISSIELKVSSIKSNQEVLNYILSKDISKQLDGLRVHIKTYHVRSELSLTVIICLLWGVADMVMFDWIIIGLLLIYILVNTWNSFQFYISEFLPYYITEQTLLGGKGSFGDK